MPHATLPHARPNPGRTPPGLDPGAHPFSIFARWPADTPLCAFISDHADNRTPSALAPWLRTSILAAPDQSLACRESDLRGARDPLAHMRAPAPLGVGAACSYELGRILEPAAQLPALDSRKPVDDRALPALVVHPAHAAMTHDGARNLWSCLGPAIPLRAHEAEAPFTLSPWALTTSKVAYQRSVSRAIEYIHAGDCFQVNLAHRLTASFRGSVRSLALRLFRAVRPSLGAYMEIPGRGPGEVGGEVGGAIISLSPELFLHYDASTRTVTTRPIKGTRAARHPLSDLERSSKDAAELVMIVDLMRNDLGRVCTPGSIRVDRPRDTESFGPDPASGVRHTVATISGTLAPDRSPLDLLAGAFPPGSVTGAPKIRAMQIIEELEPVARGPYCGTLAWLHPGGDATFSVPIRTLVLTAEPGSTPDHAVGTLDLHVGAGIVAESDPGAEWLETLHKAATILAPLGVDAMALDR